MSIKYRKCTMYYGLHIYDRLFGMDNKFARTIGALFSKPEEVLHSTFNGNRIKYMGAGGLYFILLTMYLILFSVLDLSFEEVISPSQEMFSPTNVTAEQLEFNKKINNMVYQNFRIFNFLTIPFFALGLMIFFRKAHLNFFEHAVIVLYSLALGLVLSISFLFIYKIFEVQLMPLQIILHTAILGYICSRYFNGSKIWLFIKGIFVYLICSIFYLLFFIAIVLIAMGINPSLIPR